MMRDMDFYVTPVLNIDGYLYSWKDNTVSLPLIQSLFQSVNEAQLNRIIGYYGSIAPVIIGNIPIIGGKALLVICKRIKAAITHTTGTAEDI